METHPHQHQHQHTDHHQHNHAEDDQAAMAELLDLDAEVTRPYLSEVMTWIGELAADPPRRILDLGSGTGTGALALAQRFTGAHVTAVDISAAMLRRLQEKARELGVADRTTTLEADLDKAWPDTGPVDLTWASASMHHLADPDRVLSEIFAALHPAGMLVVVELASFPRFLPDDIGLGRPGLEARCHAARADTHAQEMPTLGSDWAPRLRRAGFTIEAERPFTIDLAPPLPAAAGRYAQVALRRLRTAFGDRLDASDQAVLDTLIDSNGPDSVLRRGDLTVRDERTVWVGLRA
jgi:ubiquinone/menaquinone biosynthesis C-methylase UbiE